MTEIANTLTSKEYVKHNGLLCPVCESQETESYGSTEIDCGTAWQSVRCRTCGAQWTDYYNLVEYGMDEPDIGYGGTNTLKSFASGVSIVDTPGGKAVYVETKGKVMWFTTLDSPRIKRIKDEKVREYVVQALHEIKLMEKLE